MHRNSSNLHESYHCIEPHHSRDSNVFAVHKGIVVIEDSLLVKKSLELVHGLDTVLLNFNPRHACAARVTVVGSVSIFQNLTNRPTNNTTYLTGNEGQKICAVFSENAPLQS